MTTRRFLTNGKAAIAAAVVLATIVGSASASADAGTAAVIASTSAGVCGTLIALTGPVGAVACAAGGGLLGLGYLFF